MPYDPTTFESPAAARTSRDVVAAAEAEAKLAAAKARGLAAIRDAFTSLIGDADLALAPVDGSPSALDELRAVRDDALGMAEDALAAVASEIQRRAA
jgi:hypothetical protein